MSYIEQGAQRAESQFLSRVFGWMSAGLAISGVTAYLLGNSPYVMNLVRSPGLFFVLALVQLGLVFALSSFALQLSYSGAVVAFSAYAFTTGVTTSIIFLAYTQESIFQVFGITAGMFALMALYGYTTKVDLSAMGSYLFMALMGLIIASIVNLFFASAQLNLFIAGAGVVIFTLLTAYDVQRIKLVGSQLVHSGVPVHTAALIGALVLYLDFLNLFLSLLQLFGKRRD